MKRTMFVLGILLVFALASAPAYAYYPSSPYSGVDVIGGQYQPTSRHVVQYNFAYNRHFYNYVAPARTGGFFGDTTAFITGLRPGVPAVVPPVYYTNYYQQVCGWPECFLGRAGFPRASQFPVTTSPGGVLSY